MLEPILVSVIKNSIFAHKCFAFLGEHQMELIDAVAAKFHEEPGVFKLLVRSHIVVVEDVMLHSFQPDC